MLLHSAKLIRAYKFCCMQERQMLVVRDLIWWSERQWAFWRNNCQFCWSGLNIKRETVPVREANKSASVEIELLVAQQHVCVCMHVRMCLCCLCVYMYLCMYVCLCLCVCARVCLCVLCDRRGAWSIFCSRSIRDHRSVIVPLCNDTMSALKRSRWMHQKNRASSFHRWGNSFRRIAE